jgi:hypothetical protein
MLNGKLPAEPGRPLIGAMIEIMPKFARKSLSHRRLRSAGLYL